MGVVGSGSDAFHLRGVRTSVPVFAFDYVVTITRNGCSIVRETT
jgi:hypothetical protein